MNQEEAIFSKNNPEEKTIDIFFQSSSDHLISFNAGMRRFCQRFGIMQDMNVNESPCELDKDLTESSNTPQLPPLFQATRMIYEKEINQQETPFPSFSPKENQNLCNNKEMSLKIIISSKYFVRRPPKNVQALLLRQPVFSA